MKPTEAIEKLRIDVEGRLHAESDWRKKRYLAELADAMNCVIDTYERSVGLEESLSKIVNRHNYYTEGWEEYAKRVDNAFLIAGIPKEFSSIPREIVNVNWDIATNIRAYKWYIGQLELIYDDQEGIEVLTRFRRDVSDAAQLCDENIALHQESQKGALAKLNKVFGTQHSIWSALMSYEQYKHTHTNRTWE